MEDLKQFRKISYKLNDMQGEILIGEKIKDEQEIKEICMKDYLEKLNQKIEIIERKEDLNE